MYCPWIILIPQLICNKKRSLVVFELWTKLSYRIKSGWLQITILYIIHLWSIHINSIWRSWSLSGNFLECLNLALNHFDQHHLDRLLKVSGQARGAGPMGNPTAGRKALVYSRQRALCRGRCFAKRYHEWPRISNNYLFSVFVLMWCILLAVWSSMLCLPVCTLHHKVIMPRVYIVVSLQMVIRLIFVILWGYLISKPHIDISSVAFCHFFDLFDSISRATLQFVIAILRFSMLCCNVAGRSGWSSAIPWSCAHVITCASIINYFIFCIYIYI